MMFAFDQEPAFTQKIEQLVPAYIMAVFRELDLKFTHAQTGHVLPDQPDLTDDGGVVDLFRAGGMSLLPKPLSGNAEQSAKRIKAYLRVTPFELFDCSASTFFDRSMPYSSFRMAIITS